MFTGIHRDDEVSDGWQNAVLAINMIFRHSRDESSGDFSMDSDVHELKMKESKPMTDFVQFLGAHVFKTSTWHTSSIADT